MRDNALLFNDDKLMFHTNHYKTDFYVKIFFSKGSYWGEIISKQDATKLRDWLTEKLEEME